MPRHMPKCHVLWFLRLGILRVFFFFFLKVFYKMRSLLRKHMAVLANGGLVLGELSVWSMLSIQ